MNSRAAAWFMRVAVFPVWLLTPMVGGLSNHPSAQAPFHVLRTPGARGLGVCMFQRLPE